MFDVIPTPRFLRQVKKLKKKYKSLIHELLDFEDSLAQNPTQGTDLGNNTYKVRLAIESKNSGKSGGARIITYIVNEQKEVYLISIYDKSEISTIKDNDLKNILKDFKGSMVP
jgi:mRNA-degrading endonuclease RelE of RelBE toxin-antitoxin system